MVGVCKLECLWRNKRDEPLTLTRCYSRRGPKTCDCKESLDQSPFPFFLLFLKLCFSLTVAHFLAFLCVQTPRWWEEVKVYIYPSGVDFIIGPPYNLYGS